MRRYATQALVNKYDFKIDSIGTQKLAGAVQTIKLSVVKAKPAKLLDKEIICCNMATD